MTVITLDDTDPSIHYGPTGGWSAGGSPWEYNDTTTLVHSVGTASLKFTGSRIAVFGTIGALTGKNSAPQTLFTLDGGDPVPFNGTRTVDIQYNRQFYDSHVLPSGGHYLGITNNQGTLIIDYINITVSDVSSSSSSLPTGTTPALQTPPSTASNSAPPTGTILGGTLGGLAIIGLFAFAIFFVRRRDKSGLRASLITESESWTPPHQLLELPPHTPITPFPLHPEMSQPRISSGISNNHPPERTAEYEKGRRATVAQQSATAPTPSVYNSSASPPQPPDDPPPDYRDG